MGLQATKLNDGSMVYLFATDWVPNGSNDLYVYGANFELLGVFEAVLFGFHTRYSPWFCVCGYDMDHTLIDPETEVNESGIQAKDSEFYFALTNISFDVLMDCIAVSPIAPSSIQNRTKLWDEINALVA